MMEEHELIVQVLASLQMLAETLNEGGPVSRPEVADFGRFFAEFADRCHHGKEEDRLFRAMVASGFPPESGPIGVMLSEHEAGRQEVRVLRAIGGGSGPLSSEETAAIIDCAAQFVPLLYGHIQKENNILYPMAQRALPPAELARLDQSCADFDRQVLGPEELSRLKDLAASLVRRFPADPAELAAHASCGGCSSVSH